MRGWLAPLVVALAIGGAQARDLRPFAVRDAIELTQPVPGREGPVVLASPDRRRTAVLLRRGDVERNLSIYELRVYADSAEPVATATLTTSGNEPAIAEPRWSDDKTLLYLGLDADGAPQAHALDVESGATTRLTRNKQGVGDFGVGGGRIVYWAPLPLPAVAQSPAAVVIEDVDLVRLVSPKVRRPTRYGLYVVAPDGSERLLRDVDYPAFLAVWSEISISPSGTRAIVALPTPPPAHWQRYVSNLSRSLEARWSLQYTLVDLETGAVKPLVDAPTGIFNNWAATPQVLWSPDERSVIVSDHMTSDGRSPSLHVAEIDLSNGRAANIANAFSSTGDTLAKARWVANIRWSEPGRALDIVEFDNGTRQTTVRSFVRTAGGWLADRAAHPLRRRVWIEAAPSTPPRLVLARENGAAIVADLNPRLAEVRLAPVETLAWSDARGASHRGGLVLPPRPTADARVPLVIQLREFDEDRFLADGPFTTAHAAQALAAAGIAVLQFRAQSSVGDAAELDIQKAAIEAAIDALDRRGVVDRTRLGLTGFSRTCWAVKHFLVASEQPVAAAIVADGIDGGYFQYLLSDRALQRETLERVNGGSPFGTGLARWAERAPTFRAPQVTTPLRIEAIGTVLGEWEMYAALRALGRPVDLIYYPHGAHELARPTEIAHSQQGAVDWFRFWLKNEEDSDPARADQYARWRKLRTGRPPIRP